MYEVGKICIKLAGRDAGREAVIIDILDKNFVLIDGNVRRRKCNIIHLEPTGKSIDLKKNASHGEVIEAFSNLKLAVWNTKPKKAAKKPKKLPKKKIKLDPKKKIVKKQIKEAKVVTESKKEPNKKEEKADKVIKKPEPKKSQDAKK